MLPPIKPQLLELGLLPTELPLQAQELELEQLLPKQVATVQH